MSPSGLETIESSLSSLVGSCLSMDILSAMSPLLGSGDVCRRRRKAPQSRGKKWADRARPRVLVDRPALMSGVGQAPTPGPRWPRRHLDGSRASLPIAPGRAAVGIAAVRGDDSTAKNKTTKR